MRTVFLLVLLALSGMAQAQLIFTESDLRTVVQAYHPLARRAALEVTVARGNELAARGGFDPVLSAAAGRKDVEGITYYNDNSVELKVPTWYGLNLHAGREEVRGERTNPEDTKGSLSYLGFSLPVGRDLLFDKRRAALQTARLLTDASEQVRRAALNDLLHEALEDYWYWWEQHRLLQLADSTLRNAEERLRLVRTAVRLGDRAAIDSTEALAQVQSIAQQRADAALRLQKARLELSAFLWTAGGTPYDLPDEAQPQGTTAYTLPPLDSLLAGIGRHPDLQAYFFKTAALRIDRRLKFQALLPDIDVKYNALVKGDNPLQSIKGATPRNNFRYGFTLNIPLRLSEARGSWRAAKAKLSQGELETTAKERSLQLKLQQYYAEAGQLATQAALQGAAIRSYTVLLRGEETRFRIGESSLFLVNAREQKAWEALQKDIELEGKRARAGVQLLWAGGLLAPQ